MLQYCYNCMEAIICSVISLGIKLFIPFNRLYVQIFHQSKWTDNNAMEYYQITIIECIVHFTNITKQIISTTLSNSLLTLIGNISGPSPSVIFGNKIQIFFLLWRFWWRHTSNIWNFVIISQNSKRYSTYTRNILNTWRHHRQKFAVDFVSENDARWKTQFLDFVSEICQYGLSVQKW